MPNVKLNILIAVITVLFGFNCQSQDWFSKSNSGLLPIMSLAEEDEKSKISLIDFSEDEYTIDVFSHELDKLSLNFNFRLDDGLSYMIDYSSIKEITFFDLCFGYQIGAIEMSFSILNVFNFNNSDFAIEPVLERNNVIDSVYFSHEPNFSIQTAIIYSF